MSGRKVEFNEAMARLRAEKKSAGAAGRDGSTRKRGKPGGGSTPLAPTDFGRTAYLHAVQGLTLCALHGGNVRLTQEHAKALLAEIERLRNAVASASLAGNDNTAPAHVVLKGVARRAHETLQWP